MSENAAGGGIPTRLAHKVGTALVTGARRWAWTNPAVLLGFGGMALAGYIAHRVGGHRRLERALDSTVVTAGAALDPDPADTASLRHPVRKVRHAIVDRLTRGAEARHDGLS